MFGGWLAKAFASLRLPSVPAEPGKVVDELRHRILGEGFRDRALDEALVPALPCEHEQGVQGANGHLAVPIPSLPPGKLDGVLASIR